MVKDPAAFFALEYSLKACSVSALSMPMSSEIYESSILRCCFLSIRVWNSFCPYISIRSPVISLNLDRVTVSSFMRLTLLPCMILRLMITSPFSSGHTPRSLSLSKRSPASNISSIYAYSAPDLMISPFALPPRASMTESIITDFPAPVSPVRILSPFPKDTDAFLISAISFTFNSSSINRTRQSTMSLSFCMTSRQPSTVLTATIIVSSPAMQPTTSL